MKLYNRISSIFKSRKKTEVGFDIQAGTQKYQIQQFPWLFDKAPKYLNLYKELWNNVSILDNAIDTYSFLINPGYTIKSDSDSEVQNVNDIFKTIKFNKELNEIIQNTLLYGFSGSETVLSTDLKSIIRLVNVPSEDLRVDRDKRANIKRYYQINTAGSYIELNRNRFTYFARQATTDNPYGRSLFKALPFLTRIMISMQDSIGKIYKKYGSPRFHVNYVPAIQLDDPTLKSRLDKIKEKFDNPEVGEDFFSAGDVSITTIGMEGEVIKFNVEMSEILQGVMAGLKLPAGVLGYNYGSTETHLKKQLEVLLGRITAYQVFFTSIINENFMPLLAKVYNLSSLPELIFKRPIIVDEAVEASTQSINITNIQNLLGMNLITPEYAAKKLELPKLKPQQIWQINKRKEQDIANNEPGVNDPNDKKKKDKEKDNVKKEK